MKRRRKKERGFGGWIARLLLAALVAAGAYYAWAKYRGRSVEVPEWASIEKLKEFTSGSSDTNGPAVQATNLPAPVTPSAVTNQPVILETNQPAPVQVQRPEKQPPRPVRTVLEAQIALSRMGISVGCIDGQYGNNLL